MRRLDEIYPHDYVLGAACWDLIAVTPTKKQYGANGKHRPVCLTSQCCSRGPSKENLHHPWNMKHEREGEATNPGPVAADVPHDPNQEILTIRSVNLTSATTNKETILASKAIITFIQEHNLKPAQMQTFQVAAKAAGKTFVGGPLDPEHG